MDYGTITLWTTDVRNAVIGVCYPALTRSEIPESMEKLGRTISPIGQHIVTSMDDGCRQMNDSLNPDKVYMGTSKNFSFSR